MSETTPEEEKPKKESQSSRNGFDLKKKKKLRAHYKKQYQTPEEKTVVKYSATEAQKKFGATIADPTKKIILFNGGRQGGKTYAGCVETVKQIYKHKRKPNIGWIVSPTYPMAQVVMRKFEEIAGFAEYGGLIIKKFEGKLKYLMHPPAGQSEPFIIEVKTAENPDRLRGATLGFVWMDEAAMMTEEVYQILLGTILATKGIIFMTSTPRGRNWFYDLFISAESDPRIGAVKGRSVDNPHLGQEELTLMRNKLSDDFARQELDAEFVSFDGLVYRGFNYKKHVIPTMHQLPPGCEVICGIDNGFGDPFACLWVAKYDGRYYVIDEYYERGRTLDLVARSIRSKLWDRHVIRRWADPSGAQERAELDKFGISTYPARNDIFSGINCVERLFEQGRLFITAGCLNTISELGQYHFKEASDKNRGEEPVDAFNHAMDALRYAIFSESEFAVAHPVITVRDDGSLHVDQGQGSYLTADLNSWANMPYYNEGQIIDEMGY